MSFGVQSSTFGVRRSLGRVALASALTLLLAATAARAERILGEEFEQEGAWRKSVKGDAVVELVDGGVTGRCLHLVSRDKAYAYYSLDLDPKPLLGKQVWVQAKVRLENVVKGDQEFATAKIHIGATVAGKVQNFAQRFVGTTDWHDEVLVADIPADAQKVVLDLGIQNGTGQAWYDSLTVEVGAAGQAIPITLAANSGYRDGTAEDGRGTFLDAGALDLRNLPTGNARLGGVVFQIAPPTAAQGRTCIVLRGARRPAFPDRIETVIPVRRPVAALHLLCAAAWLEPGRQPPPTCLGVTVTYEDGQTLDIALREGLEIGSFLAPKDTASWHVAWTAQAEGQTVGLGVHTWTNPRPDTPLRFLRVSTPGTGAVPILAAIAADPR